MRRAALVLVGVVGCVDPDGTVEHGLVDVTVLRDELPVANALVIFHDIAGQVVDSAHTDAAGVATGETSTWGMVTVVDPSFEWRFTTVTRLSVGESLAITLTPMQNRGPSVATLDIAAPATAAPPDAVDFDVQTPCGRERVASFPATIPLYAGCTTDIPVLITARSMMQNLEDPGRALAYAAGRAHANQAFVPGNWSTSCAQLAFKSDVEMSLQIWPRLSDHVFRWVDLGFCQLVPAPSGFTAYPTLSFGEGSLAYGVGYVDGMSLRTTSILVDFPEVPPTYELMRRSLLIGDPQLSDFDGAGARWTADAALARTDAVIATLTWTLAPQSYVEWRFVLPGGASNVYVPELPSDVKTWSSLDDASEVILELRYVDASWIRDLAATHAALPLVLDGAASTFPIERNASLREYAESFHPSAER